MKIRWTDPKRIDRARTWIVGEGISIIQAEAAIREDRKVDVRWPMKKPAGEFLASRLASAVVRKRQKISQGPSLRVALSTARNLFQSFVLGRPLVIISTRHASNLGCQWPRLRIVKRRTIFCCLRVYIYQRGGFFFSARCRLVGCLSVYLVVRFRFRVRIASNRCLEIAAVVSTKIVA